MSLTDGAPGAGFRPLHPGDPVLGYMAGRGDPVTGEAVIEAACARAGWRLTGVVRDRDDGGRPGGARPGLAYALERIAAGEARGLVIGALQGVTRSLIDLAAMLEWFREARAAFVALDLGLDTTTDQGAVTATTLITFAGWTRERIAERTRTGLAAARSEGRGAGRPAVADRPELRDRIAAMRRSRMTLQAIADRLNAEGIATLRGGAKWRPSSVQAVLGYRRPGPAGVRDILPPLVR